MPPHDRASSWQIDPVRPGGQVHRNAPGKDGVHVPPLRHGFGVHPNRGLDMHRGGSVFGGLEKCLIRKNMHKKRELKHTRCS